jgi:hypothetical protein
MKNHTVPSSSTCCGVMGCETIFPSPFAVDSITNRSPLMISTTFSRESVSCVLMTGFLLDVERAACHDAPSR